MSTNEGMLYCYKCLLKYNRHGHIPKILPCGHNLCSGCVADLYQENSRYYQCIPCRLTCSWSRKPVRSLETNKAILRLLDVSDLNSLHSDDSEQGIRSNDASCVHTSSIHASGDSSQQTSCADNQKKRSHQPLAKSYSTPVAKAINYVNVPSPKRPPPRSLQRPPPRPPRTSEIQASRQESKRSPRHKSSPRSQISKSSKASLVRSSSEKSCTRKREHVSHSLDVTGSRQDSTTELGSTKENTSTILSSMTRLEMNNNNKHSADLHGSMNSLPDELSFRPIQPESIQPQVERPCRTNSDFPVTGLVEDLGYLNVTEPAGNSGLRNVTSGSCGTNSESFASNANYLDMNTKESQGNFQSFARDIESDVMNPDLPVRDSETRNLESSATNLEYLDEDVKLQTWSNIWCERHYGKECNSICLTCAKGLCSQCVAQGKHTEHHISGLEESLEILPRVIKEHLAGFSNAKKDYLDSQKETCESFQSWSKKQKTIMNERVKDLINRALRWKRDMEAEMDTMLVKMKKDYEQWDKFAEDRENQMKQCLDVLHDTEILGSKQLEQLANIKKLRKQMKKLKEKVSVCPFQSITLTEGSNHFDLGKLESNEPERFENNPVVHPIPRKRLTVSQSLDLTAADTSMKREGSQTVTHMPLSPQSPLSPVPSRDVNLMTEITIGDNQYLFHVDVNPYNDIISVNTSAKQITKYSYRNKKYELKWKKDISPTVSCREDTFKVGMEHNIVIRATNQTMFMSSDFELQSVYKGQYGVLMASHGTGHIYAAPMLRTGKYKVKTISLDHQHATELCQVTSLPKVATYPPHCAVLDVKDCSLTLLELSTGTCSSHLLCFQ